MSNKEVKKSLSKSRLTAQLVVMWVGAAACIVSLFVPSFDVFGLPSVTVFGVPGGILAIAGLIVKLVANKCPYCGSRKIGGNIGGRLEVEVECPACKKKVEIK